MYASSIPLPHVEDMVRAEAEAEGGGSIDIPRERFIIQENSGELGDVVPGALSSSLWLSFECAVVFPSNLALNVRSY